jgi:hypothetical protein
MRKRPDDLGVADGREMKERMTEAITEGAKAGYQVGGPTGAFLGGMGSATIESRRISREMNQYLHPADETRRRYYDQKRKAR